VKISVFGLGYIGSVSAGCLAALGHEVIGVDPVAAKVDLVNRGKSPVVEKDLDRLIADAVRVGRLRATVDTGDAVKATECSLICVGTPNKPDGSPDLSHVAAVSHQIGSALRHKSARHLVVIRSTVLPGTLKSLVIPLLEKMSDKKAGEGFRVGNNPEFLRLGTAVADFRHPPKIVIGAADDETADEIAAMYTGIDAPLVRTSIEVGEMVKFSDNAWHALKVTFANEIGSLCKMAGIDSHAVMDVFIQDTQLNLSSAYLRPGFAFGGSCLPKDVRALTCWGRALDLDLPVMNAILPSNACQLTRGLDAILASGKRKVSFLGISFKAGTDDMRASPLVELIERMLGKDLDIRVFDRNVNMGNLIGVNRDYLLKALPHISSLLVNTLEEALAHGEVVVVGNADPEFLDIAPRLKSDQKLIDFVRIRSFSDLKERYEGINW
jgi:GDP-mannose 6-dehydrogenase